MRINLNRNYNNIIGGVIKMTNRRLIRAGKIVTVSDRGTVYNGALFIEDGKIKEIMDWQQAKDKYLDIQVIDYRDYTITPSLVDCHTHLLEFAPSSLYPVTQATHFMAGKFVLLYALSCGITALGEQICGHPKCNFTKTDYVQEVNNLPIDITLSFSSISIGFDPITHFTSVTGSKPVSKQDLTNASIIDKLARFSDYPGENIFINATPANFTEDQVPRAGEIIYTQEELNDIASIFHNMGKKIGVHVGGKNGIRIALDAGIDVLHHAHGITPALIQKAKEQNTTIVATPMGGTHHMPNSPEEIVELVKNNITVAISTDAYLPPYKQAKWLPFNDNSLQGPEVLMLLAHPSMKILHELGMDENEILSLITLNGAKVLGKEQQFGSLEKGMDANFIVSKGIPGLEITDVNDIFCVYFRGEQVINRFD